MAVAQLWALEDLRRGDFGLFKVKGDSSQADILTTYVPRDILDRLLTFFGVY